MFWLSYVFFILCDAFLLKSVIFSHNSSVMICFCYFWKKKKKKKKKKKIFILVAAHNDLFSVQK